MSSNPAVSRVVIQILLDEEAFLGQQCMGGLTYTCDRLKLNNWLIKCPSQTNLTERVYAICYSSISLAFKDSIENIHDSQYSNL